MQVPEITYRYIYPRDVAGPTFEVLSRQLSLVASASPLEVNVIGIPKDKIFVLTNFSMEGNPGSTQACVLLQVRGLTQAGTDFHVNTANFAVTADLTQNAVWQGGVYLQGRGEDQNSVRFLAFFDATTNGNTLGVGVQGIVIPRGNYSAF